MVGQRIKARCSESASTKSLQLSDTYGKARVLRIVSFLLGLDSAADTNHHWDPELGKRSESQKSFDALRTEGKQEQAR